MPDYTYTAQSQNAGIGALRDLNSGASARLTHGTVIAICLVFTPPASSCAVIVITLMPSGSGPTKCLIRDPLKITAALSPFTHDRGPRFILSADFQDVTMGSYGIDVQ